MLEARQYSPFEKPRPQFIPDALTRARNDFVAEEKRETCKAVIAYELKQDSHLYQELDRHKNEAGYEKARAALNAFTKRQVETHIGERLHVGISKYDFRIKKGEIWPEDAEEPMLNMIKRGRDYRKHHGEPVDWRRESAEVLGFEQIQMFLGNALTSEGSMMLSISPQGDIKNGSIYKQNFYDVYQKTKDGVIAYRFTSGLTPAESYNKVRNFDWRYRTNHAPADYEFLSRPIQFDSYKSPFKTPLEVHDYMHKEHEHLRQEEFEEVVVACASLITSYINMLCDNPYDLIKQEKTFTALLNYADIVAGKIPKVDLFQSGLKKDVRLLSDEASYVRHWIPTQRDIQLLSEKPVRHVDTGCGASGSKTTSASSPFSVAEFSGKSLYGSDKHGSRSFTCPSCHQTNIRPVNGFVMSCQHCGSVEVAC